MTSTGSKQLRSEFAWPCLSLPHALCDIACEAGGEIDFVDLCAAMGLSFEVSSVRDQQDASRRRMYARDAFVDPAARIFGITLRDVHPPEAARGIDRLPEFEQHFDASYRPIILRALEHDQPVLAWQGWERPCELHWGVITGTCDDGVGFIGRVAAVSGAGKSFASPASPFDLCRSGVTLDRPPVQLYVVETAGPRTPDPHELREVAIAHARQVLSNALADRFGVTTGAGAYDRWIEQLRAVDEPAAAYLIELTNAGR